MSRNPDTLACFEQAKNFVPEEVKALLETEILNCRRRIEECTGRLEFMKPKPRDFTTMANLDNGTYWKEKHRFYDAIDLMERDVYSRLFDHIGRNPAETTTLDLGCGTGRYFEVAADALAEEGHNKEAIEAFVRNSHGLELDSGNVELSRLSLGKLGMPPENIHQGNFRDPLPEELRGKFDTVVMMFGAFSYNNTEEKAIETIQNIEAALKPGGIFLFDTIELTHHQRPADQKTLRSFEDLTNFHTNLARMQAAENKHVTATVQNLRFQVAGSTAVTEDPNKNGTRHPDNDMIIGEEAYVREIITPDYFNYLLAKMGSSLEPIGSGPVTKRIEPFDEKAAGAIGRRWIQQNGMDLYLRTEVAYRLAQERTSEHITPLYSAPHVFTYPEAANELGLEINSEAVTHFVNNVIAPRMVNTYGKQYCYFRKQA